MDDRQLHWVQKARSAQWRAGLLGPLACECVRGLGRGGPAWRQRLISVLYEEAGPELLDHAEPTSLRQGVLTFQVSEPALAYHFRLNWEQRLLRLLAARVPQAGVHTIRFAASRPRA